MQILHLEQKNGRLFQRAVPPEVANEIVTLMWLCWKPTYSHTTPKEQWNTIIICSHLKYVSLICDLIIIKLSFLHVYFLVCSKCALLTFKNCDTEILGADTVSNVVLTYSRHIKNRQSYNTSSQSTQHCQKFESSLWFQKATKCLLTDSAHG